MRSRDFRRAGARRICKAKSRTSCNQSALSLSSPEMRKAVAIACCALYATFGSMGGLAHVHDSADHHEESRGLHLDHAHFGNSGAHGHSDHQHSATFDFRHVEHHEGDAVSLTTDAANPGQNTRVAPAIAAARRAIEEPSRSSTTVAQRPNSPRGPPNGNPPRLRGPPA